jgi:hypothetical protein
MIIQIISIAALIIIGGNLLYTLLSKRKSKKTSQMLLKKSIRSYNLMKSGLKMQNSNKYQN